MTQTQPETFDQWCIVEQLGHRRLAGRVVETTIAGVGFLRLDVPGGDGVPVSTHLLSPGSVYALHPVDEATARAVAAHCRPQPVYRWELPAAPVDQAAMTANTRTMGDEPDVDDLADAYRYHGERGSF